MNIVLNGSDLVFEGYLANAYETTLRVVEPTADNVVRLPDVSGDVNDIRNELDAGESVEAMFKSIQTKANIEMYQVEGDTTGQISVAVYPKGAWTTTTLQAAIRALGTTVGGNNVDVSGSSVSSSGLEFV